MASSPSPRRGQIEEAIDSLLGQCYANPLAFVMHFFPWDTNPAIQLVELAPQYRKRFDSKYGPDVWACEFLDELGTEIRKRKFNGQDAVDPIQFATVSGHGVGKSVLVAWLTLFIMNTRPYCRGTITANSDPQLRTKTWAEVGKWHGMSLTSHRFDFNSSRGNMSLRAKVAINDWFCTGQTSRAENSESFAGQHAANSTSFYIFDEASGIDDVIYNVRRGGLTDGEPMVFDFGNPTRNSGTFYEECEGKLRHRFSVRHIDSRSVAITNKAYFQTIVDDFGEDHDETRVRVKGEFPRSGSIQFIGTELAADAVTREDPPEDRHTPIVLGVDVARFGDDESVIAIRRGNDARSWPPRTYSKLDTVQLAGKVVEVVNEFRRLGQTVAAIFVDGGGVGGGVVDQLRALGYAPLEVNFGGSPTDATAYRYKGDEMWGRMRDGLKRGLCLPRPQRAIGADVGASLREQLTTREYGINEKGQIRLESKDAMRKRGVGSPDIADALALTFAQDVAMAILQPGRQQAITMQVGHDYDPFDDDWHRKAGVQKQPEYDPYR